jgi:hypothetical protein
MAHEHNHVVAIRTTLDTPELSHEKLRMTASRTGASIGALIVPAIEEKYIEAHQGAYVITLPVTAKGKLGPAFPSMRTHMTLFFPDLNVWLAFSVAAHAHNGERWKWLNLRTRDTKLISLVTRSLGCPTARGFSKDCDRERSNPRKHRLKGFRSRSFLNTKAKSFLLFQALRSLLKLDTSEKIGVLAIAIRKGCGVKLRLDRMFAGNAMGHFGGSSYSSTLFNFGIRQRLNAAAVNTTSQSTLSSPRSFTLRSPATAFIQPNVRSINGRFCWLMT